jgi:hypothetical protein
MAPVSDEQVFPAELLKRTPLDQLERTVEELKKRLPAAEVRRAMLVVFARAPLSDFETLKDIYLRQCADATE